MCHLALLLPILALPLFWLFPPGIAVPAYVAVLLVTCIIYLKLVESCRLPIVTGREALLHMTGRVEQTDGCTAVVRINSECWSAVGENLEPGDRVEISGIDGLVLRVRRSQPESALSRVMNADTHACHQAVPGLPGNRRDGS